MIESVFNEGIIMATEAYKIKRTRIWDKFFESAIVCFNHCSLKVNVNPFQQ